MVEPRGKEMLADTRLYLRSSKACFFTKGESRSRNFCSPALCFLSQRSLFVGKRHYWRLVTETCQSVSLHLLFVFVFFFFKVKPKLVDFVSSTANGWLESEAVSKPFCACASNLPRHNRRLPLSGVCHGIEGEMCVGISVGSSRAVRDLEIGTSVFKGATFWGLVIPYE